MSGRSPRPQDREFAATLRTARLRAGVSQEQLGAALGLAQQSVCKVETLTRTVTVGEAHDFAALLGLSLPELLSGDVDKARWVGCQVCRDGVPEGFRCGTCGATP